VSGLLRAVIWDVGGTLVERRLSERDVVLRALAEARISPLALRPESVERLRQYRADALLRWRSLEDERAGFREMAAALVDGLAPPASAGQVDLIARVFAGYDDVYAPIPGMREVLAEVQARGLRQAVVSNWPPSLRRFLRHHRLEAFFEVVVCSAEEGVVKPDPELLRRALQRLGLPPARAVYVGDDGELDIAPAEALGMLAIHFSVDPEHRAAVRDAAALRSRLSELLGRPG